MLQYLCNFEQTLFTGVTTSRFNQLSFILTRIDFVSVLSKTFFFSLKAQNTANAENLFVYFNNLVLSISKLSSQDKVSNFIFLCKRCQDHWGWEKYLLSTKSTMQFHLLNECFLIIL